ncbi:hypothetical protein [Actinomadura fibrosa]|uniref:Uncharacterized protein n=1 Tax=Actinomadura fibrosa TaxID=111802 RepID=A0ABW2XQM1_9ACTN|nr:hypothetical protein [Actinomadura fibrosa]
MKRSSAAVPVLALMLALSGCGGSDDGGTAASSTAASTPAAPAPSPDAPSDAAGAGKVATPRPSGGQPSQPAQLFNQCMKRQGVQLPSPNPKRTPSQQELAKLRTALKACVKSLSASPTPR